MTNTPDNTDQLKRALVALKELRGRLDTLERARTEPIAIVGVGLRLPGGADSPDSYWQMLANGVDAITEIPADRWDTEALFDTEPTAMGKVATRWGGFLDNLDQFDPQFFGIAPREAVHMDPQQRLLLECAWEALERAGLTREQLAGEQVGVFVGVHSHSSDYFAIQTEVAEEIGTYTGTGTSHSVLAGRLAYLFDWHGPAVTVDTACSSSLVAAHLAVQSLRSGECHTALVGGVNLILTPEFTMSLSRLRMMASHGRCKTFDADADGFVRAEGCSVIVLKRLSDAVAAGDNILALIRGSAVNQDGSTNGLTAPNGLAQQMVIKQALTNAGVEASQIGLIEAHGTGTALGDPIEVEALAAVLGDKPERVYLGSAKANIGHAEGAAGLAGLIKAALSLKNQAVPPLVHFTALNPHISFDGTTFEIATALTPMDAQFAGVSSFGWSGSNAHVILEKYNPLPPTAAQSPLRREGEQTGDEVFVLPISAQSPDAVRDLARAYREMLVADNGTPLHDIAYTASLRRTHHDERLAVVGRTHDELIQRLNSYLAGQGGFGVASGRREAGSRARLAFVFSGQGPQWWAMGRDLLENNAVFRQTIEDIDGLLSQHASWSLLKELTAPEDQSRLDQTEIAQPAIFALQVALAAVWQSWGVVPGAVVGHSIGEVAAAHVAGVLSLEDAVKVVYHRARLMQQATGKGKMVAVELPVDAAREVVAVYADRVSVGAVNSPTSTVISGEPAAIEELVHEFQTHNIASKMLRVNYAFHSPQMEAFQGELTAALKGIQTHAAHIPIYSTVYGKAGGEYDAAYWARNIRQPVLFADAVGAMADAGFDIFLELSPHPALSAYVTDITAAHEQQAVVAPCLRRDQPGRVMMAGALATVYAQGLPVDWAALFPDGGQLVQLPTYRWQHQRYWYEAKKRRTVSADEHPLLGHRLRSPGITDTIYESRLSADYPAFLGDHRVLGRVIVPMTAYLEMAMSAIPLPHSLPNAIGKEVGLSDITLLESLVIEDETLVQMIVRANGEFELVSLSGEDWKTHATGKGHPLPPTAAQSGEQNSLEEVLARCTLDVENVYAEYAARGLEFGVSFLGGEGFWKSVDSREVLVKVRLAEGLDAAPYTFHPAMLDACLHALIIFSGEQTYLPIGMDSLQVFGKPGEVAWSHVTLREAGKSITLDVRIFNDDGQLIATLDGVRFAPARRVSTNRALHQIEWRAKALDRVQAGATGDWLFFADERGGTSQRLIEYFKLKNPGVRIAVVYARDSYGTFDGNGFFVNPARVDDFQRLFGSLTAPVNVVYLWGLDTANDQQVICGGVFNLLKAESGKIKRLYLVSADEPAQAALNGLRATITLEYPHLNTTYVEQIAPSDEVLADELLANDAETQIRLTDKGRFVARLVRFTDTASKLPDVFQLEVSERGEFDNLTFKPAVRPEPKAGEVLIRVHATGLNFRDVLRTLGTYAGEDHSNRLGEEFAGEVVAVGADVINVEPGDRVMGIMLESGAFATYAITDARLVVPIPENLGYNEAASVPIAYLTAYYALFELGQLRPGDRVLIHAAAGGVGIAAVRLAQWGRAEVFATASQRKHDFVRSMGVQHVLDSRSLDFAGEIMKLTGGEGIDVVLNSLAGDFIPASFSTLRAGGCFLEIGKTGIWSAEEVRAYNPDLDYHVIYLGSVAASDPDLLQTMLHEISGALADGKLQPLPVEVFAMHEAVNAFRHMAAARHIGKIVLVNALGGVQTPVLDNVTYLISGGSGALGLITAHWLAEQGARHIALLSRSAADSQLTAKMLEIGAHVRHVEADVADIDQLQAALQHIRANMPPIRGVIHAAGVNADALIPQQTPEKLETVMRPKVDGALNLHALTKDMSLDFFVMYSSISAVIGQPGQANYTAANAVMDAFAHHLRAQGYRATSINWGVWDSIGMTAAVDQRIRDEWAAAGLTIIAPESGMAALNQILQSDAAQVVVQAFDWPKYTAARGALPLFEEVAARTGGQTTTTTASAVNEPTLLQKLADAPPSKRRGMLVNAIREHAVRVLGLDLATHIDPQQPLNTLGLDSLMAVELRNGLARGVGQALPATLLFDYPTTAALADYLSGYIPADAPPETGTMAEVETPAVQEAADLQGLSDDELEALLLQELSSGKKKK